MGKRNRTPGSTPDSVGMADKNPFASKPGTRKSALGVGGIVTLGGLGGLVLGAPAWAGPDGGIVTHGAAAIQRQGSITTITQATDRAALSWQSFDIGAGETVQFRQPSTSSIALNTILERKPTEIQGNLTANGQVWLQNPQGVLFGRNATVDVGGLLATTAHVDEAAFAEGRGRIEGSGGQGSIINRGDIAAGEGGVALIAPHVENAGQIAVTGGSAELAAATGFTVDTHGDGLLSVVVDAADAEALSLINEGTITAEGGVVRLTAAQAEGVRDSLVHVGGIVEATGIEQVGGEIVITGGSAEGGVALVSGAVTATKGNQGGQIAVNAAEIRLEQGSRIEASGPNAGGLIEIGPRAAPVPPIRIAVAAEAALVADATASDGTGDAGRIEFWSTESTDFKGFASTSAAGYGDGGFVDISSAGQLGFNGTVATDAVSGTPGELLFDPDFIEIGFDGTGNAAIGGVGDVTVGYLDSPNFLYISATALNTRMADNSGATTLQATNGIAVIDGLTIADHTLNLQAGGGDNPTISINAVVSLGSDAIFTASAENVIIGYFGGFQFIGANTNNSISLTGTNTVSALYNGSGSDTVISRVGATSGSDVFLYGGSIELYRDVDITGGDLTIDASDQLIMAGDIDLSAGYNNATLSSGSTATLSGNVTNAFVTTVEAPTEVIVSGNIASNYVQLGLRGVGDTNTVTLSGATINASQGLYVTAGSIYVDGGSLLGQTVSMTADQVINFSPSTVNLTNLVSGSLYLTSNSATYIGTNGNSDIDVDGYMSLNAGDAGTEIVVGGGSFTLNLDIGRDLTLSAGTGDVTINANQVYVGTAAGVTGTLNASGGAVTVAGPGIGNYIYTTGNAEFTGATVLTTAQGEIVTGGSLTLTADSVTVEGLVNSMGTVTFDGLSAVTVDQAITGAVIRLDALNGLLTLGMAADLEATDAVTVAVPHPLMMRAADFSIDGGAVVEADAVLAGFTDAGESTASIGGTTGIITNDEYEVLGDGTEDLTVVANARDDFTGPTTLIIGDLDAPSGGDTSLSQLSFGASGEIQVTGEISGGGFSDEVREGGWPIELGTREGVNGHTTNFVPDTIDVSGRIGVIDNGEGFDLEPPDGITFIANDDVTTSTGLTDSSLIFFSAGTSVIDVGGAFLQENTTGAASPLDDGVPSAGSDFSALRIDRATRTEIFGIVNEVGGALARFEVEVAEGVTITNLLQINDCVVQAATCVTNIDPDGDDLFEMTDEDTPSDPIDVLDSFDDEDGDTLELVSLNGEDVSPGDEIPGPEGGVFIIGENGEVVFDPQDDFNTLMVGESVSFDVAVVVSDGEGGTANATLTVTVDGVNDAPTAMDADIDTTADMLADPLGVDEVALDVDMDPLAFSEIDGQAVSPGDTVQLAGGGSITVASDGSLVFNPAGVDASDPANPTVITVPVTVSDGNGGLASATVTISVSGANGAPIGMAGSLTTNEDMASGVLDTLGLFEDPEMQDLTLVAVDGQPVEPGSRIAGPEGGVIVVGANGELFFDPAGAFDLDAGEDASFTIDVTVADIFDATATAPVTVTVLGLGGVIVLLPGEIETTEDMVSDPLAVGSLGGDDVVGDLSVDAVNGESIGAGGGTVVLDGGGSLIVGADGSLIFDPGDDFQGLMEGASDSLNVTLTLTDDEGQTGTTPVAIDISGLNDDPTDGAALIETTEDMISGGISPEALGMDPDMDALAIAAIGDEPVSPGSTVPLGDGFLVIDGDGNLFFDPAGNFGGLGMDETVMLEVDVTVVDPFGGSAVSTLNVNVLGLDSGLVPMDGAISTTEDVPSTPLAPTDLAEDPDMGVVTIVGLGEDGAGALDLAEGGRLFIDGDGNLVFDPQDDFQTLPAGQNGPQQQVEVTLQDAGGGEVTSTVTIDVLGQNDDPVVDGGGMLATDEDSQSPGFSALDVVSDIDQGDELQVVAVNGTILDENGQVDLEMGTVTVAPDGTLVFDPAGDFDSLQVGEADMLEVVLGVVDNAGGLGEVTVEIDVTGLNDAPTAVDDGPVESGAFGTTTVAVLDNDFDPESDPISVISVTESTVGGTVTIGENGELIFNAGSDFLDLGVSELVEFSVEYEITDGQDGFDTAFATFQVSGEGGFAGIDRLERISSFDEMAQNEVIVGLIEAGVLPPQIIATSTFVANSGVISDSVVTPDPEVTFGFFNVIGFISPTLEEEEPVTNRADDENWPSVY